MRNRIDQTASKHNFAKHNIQITYIYTKKLGYVHPPYVYQWTKFYQAMKIIRSDMQVTLSDYFYIKVLPTIHTHNI